MISIVHERTMQIDKMGLGLRDKWWRCGCGVLYGSGVILGLVVIQGHKRVTAKATVASSIPIQDSEIFDIFVFHFGKEAKRGVEFRYSTHNASIKLTEGGERFLLTG